MSRTIIARTRGRTHGPITRLVSPGDIGEMIKPFVFLDYFEIAKGQSAQFGLHPHSGIATLTAQIEGDVDAFDASGSPKTLPSGGIEWMQAGGGVWHGGPMRSTSRVRGYQLWVALPPSLENAKSTEVFVRPDEVPMVGPARVLLGSYGDAANPIEAPSLMTYLHVKLKPGESWRYEPPTGHDVAWIAVYEGGLRTPVAVPAGELAVFEAGSEALDFEAEGESGFVLGSAVKHPYDLALGYYSVHTNPQALKQGEARIAELGQQLRAAGRLQ